MTADDWIDRDYMREWTGRPLPDDLPWFWGAVAQAALQKQVQAWQDLHAAQQRNHQ